MGFFLYHYLLFQLKIKARIKKSFEKLKKNLCYHEHQLSLRQSLRIHHQNALHMITFSQIEVEFEWSLQSEGSYVSIWL